MNEINEQKKLNLIALPVQLRKKVEDEVRKVQIDALKMEMTSLQSKVGTEDDSELGDFVVSDELSPEEEYFENEVYREMLENLIARSDTYSRKRLSDREKIILVLRYGIDFSFLAKILDIDNLAEREKIALTEAYKKHEGYPVPMTLEEVGEIYDLTRERIRQLQNKAEKKLYDVSKAEDRLTLARK